MLCSMTAVQGEPTPANVEGNGWTVDDSEFGARLALVRQRLRWNIKEAATECGLPPASWASWEAGAMPRQLADTCDRIAQRTGADYLWLLAGSSRSGTRRRSTHGCPTVDRPDTIQINRPRDNRPPGRPLAAAGAGITRTAYADRTKRRRRDR